MSRTVSAISRRRRGILFAVGVGVASSTAAALANAAKVSGIVRRHDESNCGIILPAGCGGESPVAGAIGWELGGRSPSSPPPAASSLAFIRCIVLLNPGRFETVNVCTRGTRPLGRVLRCVFTVSLPGLQESAYSEDCALFLRSSRTAARIIARQRLFQFQLCEEVDMSWEKEGLMLVFCCEKLICHLAVGRKANGTI